MTNEAASPIAVPSREKIAAPADTVANRRALAASIVLHVLLVLALLWSAGPPGTGEPEPAERIIEVEFAAAPPPQPPPPPPPPPRPAEPPAPALIPPPPPPQLVEGEIAPKATAPRPREPAPRAANQAPRSAQPRQPARAETRQNEPQPKPPEGEGPSVARVPTIRPSGQAAQNQFDLSPRPGNVAPGPQVTQTESDYLLAQVVPYWILDYRAAKYRDLVLGGSVIVQPNGMLAPPFGKSDPWNPRAMIANYDNLLRPGNDAVRVALETFLQALKMAQPLRLPPSDPNQWPKQLPMSFRLGDL